MENTNPQLLCIVQQLVLQEGDLNSHTADRPAEDDEDLSEEGGN